MEKIIEVEKDIEREVEKVVEADRDNRYQEIASL